MMRRFGPVVTGIVVALAMLLPIACVVLYSVAGRFTTEGALPAEYTLRWYREFGANRRAMDALWTSLRVATLSTLVAVMAGWPAAWVLARRRSRFGRVVEATVLFRAAVPIIVLALGTAALLYRIGGIDQWWSLVLAHACGGLPFVVYTARPAFERLDPDAADAARDLGAGPIRRSLLAGREAAPALIGGALFAFLFSLDEFALTFLIAGNEIVTLPVLLYGALQSSSVQAASAVSVVLLVPSAAVAIGAAWAIHRAERSRGVR